MLSILCVFSSELLEYFNVQDREFFFCCTSFILLDFNGKKARFSMYISRSLITKDREIYDEVSLDCLYITFCIMPHGGTDICKLVFNVDSTPDLAS